MEAIPFSQPGAQRSAAQADHELVVQLQRSEVFRDYQKAFEGMTALPLTLRAAGSFQPPWHGSRPTNAFCALMAGRNKSCSECLQMQQRIEEGARAGVQTFECAAGLNDSAIPVRLGERVVAYLQTGQIVFTKPTEAAFKKAWRHVAALGEDFDVRAVRQAFLGTRVVTRPQYDSILQLLSIFSQQLSELSNQLMVRQVMQENPTVMRAREYIAEHYGEELSLGLVAKSVHMSRFYFCKLFKESTGLTFVEYLTRTRVEAVKRLLLDPHKRMSEAAYEAGFQSLSQFNRAFRAIVGESPTRFSERHRQARPLPGRLHAAA